METAWRPFLVPVKKLEISERESIQEFPKNRSDRFSRRLVLSFKSTPPSSSQLDFFWVFGQDRVPTLLLSPKAAQLVARPDLLVEHNTRKLQGLVQNVYDILLVLLVEEYFSRSTIHDQAFFFFSYSLRKFTLSICSRPARPAPRPKIYSRSLDCGSPHSSVFPSPGQDVKGLSSSFSQLARCVASWNRGGIFRRRPPAARSVKHPAGGACSTKTGRRAGRCKSLEVEQEQRELRLEPYPARSDALESSRRRRGALNPKKLVGKPLSLRARNKRALTRWRRPRSRD